MKQAISWKKTSNLIKKDLYRLKVCKHFLFWGGKKYITNHSFKITLLFRMTSYCGQKKGILKGFYFLLYLLLRYYQRKFGIQLSTGTKIGGGITFPHYGNIVINGGAVIGNNATIMQGVTIGSVRGKGCPIIGNNVVICANAVIVGNINIGNNVMIGAGSVVTKNFPDNVTIAGNPAKIINYNGIKNCNLYL